MINNDEFNSINQYDGELGAIYTKEKTKFILWSPPADKVELALYEGNDITKKIEMTRELKGIWSVEVEGDLNGTYYNYIVNVNNSENVVVDPYAKAVGVNGLIGMVIDMKSTDPEGWEEDKTPKMDNVIDSVLYELHIRDFSIDEYSGVEDAYKGKYLAFTQSGTKIPGTDVKTCIDHIKELGINTVHLLPTFDYCTVDEANLENPEYNWGYDPDNYNVPEGSYSTDPFNGAVRIKEFKQMVMALHNAGLRVVMDMVYNHTYRTQDSNLNKAVPGYYYRTNEEGYFTNGSGCGNELASERPMVRKFIVDSILHWAKDYHIDGFRFDLMGLEDIETMKQIRLKLDEIDKSLIMYGEGWTGGGSSLPESEAALKHNAPKFENSQIAMFNDNIRDGIKGHVFSINERGFINGQTGYEETIKFGVVAATNHSQVKYNMVANSKEPWANQPYQTINYVSAHDNHTLWDKLQLSTQCFGFDDYNFVAMNKLSALIIFTSQGIPFIQAGEEFARTKVNPDGTLNENSYNAPDSVNKLDWNRKIKYKHLFDYYKGLIEMRKSHKAFRMDTTAQIQDNITFLDSNMPDVIIYSINGEAVGDDWKKIVVVYNANDTDIEVDLPGDNFAIVVNGDMAGNEKIQDVDGFKCKVRGKSGCVLVNKESFDN